MTHVPISIETTRPAARTARAAGTLNAAGLIALVVLAIPHEPAGSPFESPARPAAHAGVQPPGPQADARGCEGSSRKESELVFPARRAARCSS